MIKQDKFKLSLPRMKACPSAIVNVLLYILYLFSVSLVLCLVRSWYSVLFYLQAFCIPWWSIKTARWSLISVINSWHNIVLFSMSLVNMISIKVAQWMLLDWVSSFLEVGSCCTLCWLILQSSFVYLNSTGQYWNPHKWKVLSDL